MVNFVYIKLEVCLIMHGLLVDTKCYMVKQNDFFLNKDKQQCFRDSQGAVSNYSDLWLV